MEMHPELAEYKQYEAEIKETLELQYQMALFNNDIESAYNTVGRLMEYKLIPIDDPRIEKTNKSYKAAGISKDHRFRYDYRKETGYIPSWLYGNLDLSRTVTCNTLEHCGKRVEGNYEGDTLFSSFPMSLKFHLCTTNKQVTDAFERIGSILKSAGKKVNVAQMETLCKQGVYRVYGIEVSGNCISSFRTLGYVVLHMTNDGVAGTMILRYSAIIGNWLPVKDTINCIINTMNTVTDGGKYTLAISCDAAVAEQEGLLNKSKATIELNEKLVNKQDKN